LQAAHDLVDRPAASRAVAGSLSSRAKRREKAFIQAGEGRRGKPPIDVRMWRRADCRPSARVGLIQRQHHLVGEAERQAARAATLAGSGDETMDSSAIRLVAR